jgi:hypothetical protein
MPTKMTAKMNGMIGGLLALAGAANLMAFNGPILDEPPTEYMVDAFDEAKPAFEFKGAPGAKVEWRGGVAKEGYGSVQVDCPPGKSNQWRLTWKFPEPKDLSDYGVFSFWYMPESDGWHRPWIKIYKKDGWFLTAANNLDQSRQGVWQRVAIDRNAWGWYDKAKHSDGFADVGGQPIPLDLHDVTGISILTGRGMAGRRFSIDSIGFSRPVPPYQGPTVSIERYGTYLKDRPALYQPADAPTPYALPLVVENVPDGEKAMVKVTATDFVGRRLYDKVFEFVGGANNQEKIEFTDDRPNHIRVQAVLSLKGKDVYQSTVNLGCVEAPDFEDAMPNPDSIFGMWCMSPSGEDAQRLGVKWTRLKGSTLMPPDADGHRKLLGERAAWQNVEQGCFSIAAMGGARGRSHRWPKLSDEAGWAQFEADAEQEIRYLQARGNRVYEVTNEENAHGGGSLEQFVRGHEAYYKAAHKVQPECEVLGACTYNVNPEWLESICKLGASKWMDGVVMHGYHPPEEFRDKVRQVREVMRKYGMGDKKLYITELGFMAFPNPESEAQQARDMVRSYVYGLAEGVAVIIYHNLWSWGPPSAQTATNKSWDLLWFDQQPRPGYVAYAALTRRLENAKFVRELKMPGPTQQGFEFEKRGKTVLVLWDLKNSGEFLLDAKSKGGAALINIMGQKSALTPGADGRCSVTLGPDPVYVEYAKE